MAEYHSAGCTGGVQNRSWSAEPHQPVFLRDESNDLTDNAAWLRKKSRLSVPILRVAKVAQADANQAKPLVRSETDTL
jgi:hypothetical protein